jgi:hypothetical protein
MTSTTQMTELLASIYRSFASGDASPWEQVLAPDCLVIGTDEAEWWQGKGAVLPVIKAQLGQMSASGIRLTGGDAIVAEKGDLVWAADRPTLHLPDGTSTALRATVVASRVEGSLVIEQFHLSAGGPNEEVFQQTLTL